MTTVEINGLKDMIACNTRISSIIDDHLSYSGYYISEFMDYKASFEEVIYLLWNGHLPTQMELKYFEAELRKNYDISDAVEQCILIQSRPHLHPMSVLRSTVSLLGDSIAASPRSLTYISAHDPDLGHGKTPIHPNNLPSAKN